MPHPIKGLFALAVMHACVPAWAQLASAPLDPPVWAYPVNPPGFQLPPDDGSVRRVPDSAAAYSIAQTRDRFLAPDWHPADHAPLPGVVATGRKPGVSACGYCHRAEGTGGPENAGLAGLPFAYIVEQMVDYRSGARSTAVPNRAPQVLMIASAKAVTDDEVREAAAYFSSLAPRAILRIVESGEAPKTTVANWVLARVGSGEMEAIGHRIIEVADVQEHFESRDTHASFTAYVPAGSVARGRALVGGSDPATPAACSTCHGPDLRGLGAVPAIAGRSPTYVFRQLYEIQAGFRSGPGSAPMKEIVARLSHDDMIGIAAYLATLKP